MARYLDVFGIEIGFGIYVDAHTYTHYAINDTHMTPYLFACV